MLKPSLVCRTCWKTFDSCLNVLCCNCIFKYKFGQLYAWQLYEQLDEEAILPWKVDKCKDSDGEGKIELYDGVHCIARYTSIYNFPFMFFTGLSPITTPSIISKSVLLEAKASRNCSL